MIWRIMSIHNPRSGREDILRHSEPSTHIPQSGVAMTEQSRKREVSTHHNVTCTPVQGHTKVLDISILPEKILQILLGSFLIQSSNDDDPSFDGCMLEDKCDELMI